MDRNVVAYKTSQPREKDIYPPDSAIVLLDGHVPT